MYAVYKRMHSAQLPTSLRSTASATCVPSYYVHALEPPTHHPRFPLSVFVRMSAACYVRTLLANGSGEGDTFSVGASRAAVQWSRQFAVEPTAEQSQSPFWCAFFCICALSVVFVGPVSVCGLCVNQVERIVHIRGKYDIVRFPVTGDIHRQL